VFNLAKLRVQLKIKVALKVVQNRSTVSTTEIISGSYTLQTTLGGPMNGASVGRRFDVHHKAIFPKMHDGKMTKYSQVSFPEL
jgi:hypothetical protein